MLLKVEEAVRVQQNNDQAVAFAQAGARLLERVVVHGDSVAEALQWGKVNLEDEVGVKVNEALGLDEGVSLRDAVGSFGKACSLPGSFIGAICALNMSNDLSEAVSSNILASGDQCSRSQIIGALLGAQLGDESRLPSTWVAQTSAYAELKAQAEVVVNLRYGAAQ